MFLRVRNFPIGAILAALLLTSLTYVGAPNSYAADTAPYIKWIAPISTESTYLASDQTFTPSWEISSQGGGGVSSNGTVMYSSATSSSSGTCGAYSVPNEVISGSSAITIQNNHCYRWTFDPSVSAGAQKPTNSAGTVSKSNLTVELRIFDQSCVMSTLTGASTGKISVEFTNSRSVGFDCVSIFRMPQGIASVNYLLVGAGGAGGYGFTTSSLGGGGGGGGGDVKAATATSSGNVTPGRTYEIQVGAGARTGTAAVNTVTCLHAGVSAPSLSTSDQRGGDSFIRQAGLSTRNSGGVWALGGACPRDGGLNGYGTAGGLNGNGVNGGRGGNDTYASSGTRNGSTCTASNPCGVAGFEGSGGGGGANPLSLGSNTNCRPDSTYHALWPGAISSPWASCDAWDIDAIGGIGGSGGDGLLVSWYQGSAATSCSNYFGGGGGGGGSVAGSNATKAGVPGFGSNGSQSTINYIYSWNSTTYTYETYTAGSAGSIPYWVPVGGPGGKGGGGSASTSPYKMGNSAPSSGWSLNVAGSGVDKCGGGGGGGISGTANALGVGNASSAITPGNGGNGVAAFEFSYDGTVTNSGIAMSATPDFIAPSILPISPNVTSRAIPIKILQNSGSGYLCIDIEDPATDNTTKSAYGNSTNIRLSTTNGTSTSVEESGTVSSLITLANNITISTVSRYWSSNMSAGYISAKKLYLRVRFAGVDIFSKFTCTTNFPSDKSTDPDLSYQNSLKQSLAISETTLTRKYRTTINKLKNGSN